MEANEIDQAEVFAELQRLLKSEPLKSSLHLASLLEEIVAASLPEGKQPETLLNLQKEPIFRSQLGHLSNVLEQIYLSTEGPQNVSVQIKIAPGKFTADFITPKNLDSVIQQTAKRKRVWVPMALFAVFISLWFFYDKILVKEELSNVPQVPSEAKTLDQVIAAAKTLDQAKMNVSIVPTIIPTVEFSVEKSSVTNDLDSSALQFLQRAEQVGLAQDHLFEVKGKSIYDAFGDATEIPDYRIEISVTKKQQRFNVVARTTNNRTNQVVSVKSIQFDDTNERSDGITRFDNMIAQILSYSGQIYVHEKNLQPKGTHFRCILDAREFLNSPSTSAFNSVSSCLDRLISDHPENLTGYIHKAIINTLERNTTHAGGEASLLSAATGAVEIAEQISPNSSATFLARSSLAFTTGAHDLARAYLDEAIKRNPYSTDVSSFHAIQLISTGEFAKGLSVLEGNMAQEDHPPLWKKLYAYLALTQIDGSNIKQQIYGNSLIASEGGLFNVGKILALSANGRHEEAEEVFDYIEAHDADLARGSADFFLRRGFSEEVANTFLGELQKLKIWPR